MNTFDKFVNSTYAGTMNNDNYNKDGCCKVCNKAWDNALCDECFDREECLCDECSWLDEMHKCKHK
jgi:hypothetical protein